jgi:hypothetical protein
MIAALPKSFGSRSRCDGQDTPGVDTLSPCIGPRSRCSNLRLARIAMGPLTRGRIAE